MSPVAELFFRLASVPTVPMGEHRVLQVLDGILAGIPGIEVESDRFGNRIARLRRQSDEASPVTFVAHVDHPGFLFREDDCIGKNLVTGRFEGRVQDPFFPGSNILVYPDGSGEPIRGTIVEASGNRPETDDRAVTVELERPLPGPGIGVWEVPPPTLEDGVISACACDDLAGCAAMITAMQRLAESSGPVDMTVVFTRAEEAGFCGLLALLAEEELPSLMGLDGVFVSVEISSETSTVVLGDGAIIRIGDHASTFDPRVVNRCLDAARDHSIRARRALMDRGTCEATPMIRAGLVAGGLCIPVRHYHNMNMETGRIAAEQISLGDLESLVDLISAVTLHHNEDIKSVAHGKILDFEFFLEKGRQGLLDDTSEQSPAKLVN